MSEAVVNGKMTDPKVILAFMFAGNATLTLEGKTNRYTYKIQKSELTEAEIAAGKKHVWFVKLLIGQDNENDYIYIGMIRNDWKTGVLGFTTTKGSGNYTMETLPCKSLAWALSIMLQGRMPVGLNVWHEGRCGRCNRVLTVPESIESGFGPECINLMGGMAAIQAMTYAAPAPTVVHSTTPTQGTDAPIPLPTTARCIPASPRVPRFRLVPPRHRFSPRLMQRWLPRGSVSCSSRLRTPRQRSRR